MNDQKTPGTVFVDEGVDTRAPTRSPDAPASSGDIIGANWTLTRQNFIGAPNQAEVDAYLPIIAQLDKTDDRSFVSKMFVPSRYYNIDARGGNGQINKQTLWEEVAKRRAADPSFLKDVPAKNADEFSAWVKSQEQGRRNVAQDVVRRQQGFGQNALGFGTGVIGGLADPLNAGTMLMTGGISGGGKSLLSVMARDAITNMAIETTETPITVSNRAAFGESTSPLEAAGDILTSGVAGAAFPLAGRGAKIIGNAAVDALAPVGNATQRFFVPWALGRANIGEATDADVARMFADTVPRDARTPDAQAGLYVLNRESEIRNSSPYLTTPGGLDANGERMAATSDALSQPATLGRSPPALRAPARTTNPLTQDNIIRFVLNDLEGGAKVVPFSQADGGTTKYGVAQKFNPGVDVANITEGDAMRIARQRYWLPEFNTVDPRVASIAFDANWISSPTLARKIIREAGNDVDKALEIYRARLNEIADTVPGKAKFRKGWNNRVDKLARFVGDAEPSTVRLDPEQFNGDDIAYRAAQEDLNREELRLADDTPREPDPVREFVDRQLSGDDLSSPADRQFAAANADEISADVSQRITNGTDVHPDPAGIGQAPARALDGNAPSPAETELAVRQYVDQQMGEPTPEAVARDLGIQPNEARQALAAAMVDAPARAERLNAFDETSRALSDIKPSDRRKLWHITVDGNTKVVSSLENARREVLGAASNAGTYDNVFDKVAKWDGRPRKFGGIEVSRLNESDREVAARHRIAVEPEPVAPPSLDPKTYGVDSPTDPEAHLLADSAYHDVKALADAGDTTKAQLTEGGPEMGAKELIESLDRDQSAIDAIKGCL